MRGKHDRHTPAGIVMDSRLLSCERGKEKIPTVQNKYQKNEYKTSWSAPYRLRTLSLRFQQVVPNEELLLNLICPS